jgi:hypothetical protein
MVVKLVEVVVVTKKLMMYKVIFILTFFILVTSLFGQENKIEANDRKVDANFLSSYYVQDGDNSAVTGGLGTEKLSNAANVLIINVPIDSIRSISLYGGADYYTSASTDNIDTHVSSASSNDVRGFGTLGYSWKNLKKGEIYTLKAGVSAEFDVTSFSAGFNYTKSWNESNSELTLFGQAYIDSWRLIFPKELRGTVSLDKSIRQSYNAGMLFSQILTKRMQLSLSAEAIYMRGLLSTPFHRVYFADVSNHDIERLPDSRFKVPLSARINIYPFDNTVIRSYYRYYWDDFGIKAHTVEVELPIKLNDALTLSPFYRHHIQTGANYFAPYGEHFTDEVYYSSDYDLSAFSSNKVGMGIKYYPSLGLTRSKPFFPGQRVFMFKYIEFRGAYYQRSTGMNAFIGSLNIGLSLN